MADNPVLPATGTGTADIKVATEQDGTNGQVQRIKSEWGASTVFTKVDKTTTAALPVQQVGSAGTWTDKSGALAAASTAQVFCSTNTARRGLFIQNLSSGDLWLGVLNASVGAVFMDKPALRLVPGAAFESPPHGFPTWDITIIGGTTGQKFSAYEW